MLRVDGFAVVIFLPPREHGPAHVHVRTGGQEIVVSLDPVAVLVSHMDRATACAAVRLVETHRDVLLSHWETLHG